MSQTWTVTEIGTLIAWLFFLFSVYYSIRSTILVRRGWVPREKKDQETRLEGLTEGEVTVEGLLRSGEQKASSFVPENNPEKNEWYSLDLEAMASQSGAQPVIVEMILGKERFHREGRDVDLLGGTDFACFSHWTNMGYRYSSTSDQIGTD